MRRQGLRDARHLVLLHAGRLPEVESHHGRHPGTLRLYNEIIPIIYSFNNTCNYEKEQLIRQVSPHTDTLQPAALGSL